MKHRYKGNFKERGSQLVAAMKLPRPRSSVLCSYQSLTMVREGMFQNLALSSHEPSPDTNRGNPNPTQVPRSPTCSNWQKAHQEVVGSSSCRPNVNYPRSGSCSVRAPRNGGTGETWPTSRAVGLAATSCYVWRGSRLDG